MKIVNLSFHCHSQEVQRVANTCQGVLEIGFKI